MPAPPEPLPPAPSLPPTRPGRRGYWLPGLIALLVLLGIGAGFGAGDLAHPADTTISGKDISLQISLGIQAQEASSRPPDVTCPAREPVHIGLTFQCQARSSGGIQVVQVTEIDNRGEIRWSLSQPGAAPAT